MGRLFEDHLEKAANDTVTLIHATFTVPAIKILVNAHEILTVNLEIRRQIDDVIVPWDKAAFKDLDRIRTEIVLRYWDSFNPPTLATFWYQQIGTLFQILNLSLT